MNPPIYHVSANNPGIDHQGSRHGCQFDDCIGRRVRYVILAETDDPERDVIRFREWIATATDKELRIASMIAGERRQRWAKALLGVDV